MSKEHTHIEEICFNFDHNKSQISVKNLQRSVKAVIRVTSSNQRQWFICIVKIARLTTIILLKLL